jgi:hypothetical protein
MAGYLITPVLVFWALYDLHWEFLRLWTGFELPSSWSALPCYGADLNRNILDFMGWPYIDLGAQDLNDIQRPKSFPKKWLICKNITKFCFFFGRSGFGMQASRSKEDELPPHLRLGISYDGIFLFLVRVGFAVSNSEEADDTTYDTSYKRSEAMVWIDDAFGAIDYEMDGSIVPWTMTGYDLCSFIRTWLADNDYEMFSVCEVILHDPRFADLRQHVREASIFYSHIQSVDPLETFLMMKFAVDDLAAELPEPALQFWWTDYFSLRQCQNDFKTHQVIALVRHIGMTLAEIDSELSYLRRSFCILELYATIVGGAKLLCKGEYVPEILSEKLSEQPISAKAAETRRLQDKELIDEFISSSIGFAEFDRVVTDAAIAGAQTAYDAGMDW